MATSSPYATSKVMMMVASNPLIMASHVGSNLTVVHVSDDRQTSIVTHSFLRKTECSKAYFQISSRRSFPSLDVLFLPNKELELALRRADFFK